jgi:hypothetical protein
MNNDKMKKQKYIKIKEFKRIETHKTPIKKGRKKTTSKIKN